ncbi:hypothetical protein C0Q70_00311 [Pomacea canaliculata]|uniref:Uncharacterized protein n=1 Tax=Pomacea canaliculata TaxID=400727 RepID=A0A2T7PWE5_POMCA|nr:hypothetical protein C0Q70_00311 [Pomacea canaliculata]
MDPNQNDEYLDADENEDDLLDERNIVRVIDLPDEGIIDSDEQDMEMGGEEEEGAEGGDQTPVEDMAAVVFRAHTEKPHPAEEPPEVYAVHVDPTHSGRVVTGGRDDAAYVWNITTGQVIFECTGHKNSVSCVGFSHDGLYVASADLDGLIRVWHCEKKELAWSFDCGSDIMWLQWHHSAHVLLVGTSDGDMWMWKIPGGECKTFQSHGTQSLCGKVLPDGKTACVGYADGVVKLWDLKENKAQFTWRHFTPAAVSGGREEDEDEEEEKAAILSIDCSPDNSLVISGCADATAKIFNSVSGMLVSSWNCAVNRDQDNAVEAVGFSPVAAYAATGTNSGAVEVWDLPKSSVRHTLQHPIVSFIES